MKTVYLQMSKDYTLAAASIEERENLKAFLPNQILKAKLTGTLKARSVEQNKWVHAMFRFVAHNTDDHEWDTPEKVKRNVKMALKFFKDEVIVQGNKVFFELRSFRFDEMEQPEANMVYDQCKHICAAKLKVAPEVLEANAEKEGR